MKILIIMSGYFPGKKYGGPPVSVSNFCSLLSEETCYIVTRNHDMGETMPYELETNTWIKRENCLVMYLEDYDYKKSTFETIIRNLKPDVLYLQGLFQECIVPCLVLAKKQGIKVLLAPRGELCAGAFRKKYKKIPYICVLRLTGLLSNVHFQSTSDEESAAIWRYLVADKSKIHFLPNIPSIPEQKYDRPEKNPGEARFVFLSRIHPKKNLLFALKCLESVAGFAEYDIYGPIEDEDYWHECEHVIVNLPKNVRVNYCGMVSHEEVHQIMAAYDAFLFPTLSENYGHVIAEALAVGTPVLVSDQTPWRALKEKAAGWDIPLSDPEEWKNIINSIVECGEEPMGKLHQGARTLFQERNRLETIKEEYWRVLSAMIEEAP